MPEAITDDNDLVEHYKLNVKPTTNADTKATAGTTTLQVSYQKTENGRTERCEEIFTRTRRLGSGGFGDIWLETTQDKSRCRAVKSVDKLLCSTYKVDYRRELLAMTKFKRSDYENFFVSIEGWYETPLSIVIAMEYFEHGDLFMYYESLGRYATEAETKTIGQQILEGLKIMHGHGFTHRDLKPQNIFVKEAPKLWVKIGDFGITKRLRADNPTGANTQVGTPGYIAPEIYRLHRDKTQSNVASEPQKLAIYTDTVDIWSLGCVLYELLVGSRPFLGDPETMIRYCEGRTELLTGLLSGKVSREACRTITKMMAPKPTARVDARSALVMPWFKNLMRRQSTWNETDSASVGASKPPNYKQPTCKDERDATLVIFPDEACFQGRKLDTILGSPLSAEPMACEDDDTEYDTPKCPNILRNYNLRYDSGRIHGSSSDFEKAVQFVLDNKEEDLARLLLSDRKRVRDFRFDDGDSLLIRAASTNRTDLVEVLLDSGVDVNIRNSDGENALHLGAERGPIDAVKLLLPRYRNINVKSERLDTPLHLAAGTGRLEIVKLLLNYGANIDESDKDKFTPLHVATLMGHNHVVEALLTAGANIEAKQHQNKTALVIAVDEGKAGMTDLLLRYGANPLAAEDDSWTAIHVATHSGQEQIVAVLIKYMRNIDCKTNSGSTALHIASQHGHSEVIKHLIAAGANLETKQAGSECTSLYLAVDNGHTEVARLLLAAGANINVIQDDTDETVLHLAVDKDDHDMVLFLLRHHADTEIKQRKAWTALHVAAAKGRTQSVAYLLRYNANVNARQYVSGCTPLHLAAKYGHTDIVKTLLQRQANVESRNFNGYTSLAFAVENGHDDIVKLLYPLMIAPEPTLIHTAAIGGHMHIIEWLHNYHGLSLEGQDEKGMTPLHVAAYQGNMELVKFLLAQNCDVNHTSLDGSSALHLATEQCHAKIVQVLVDHGAHRGIRNSEGRTSRGIARENQHYHILDILSRRKSSVRPRNVRPSSSSSSSNGWW